jgi:DNA replication protein DnaC
MGDLAILKPKLTRLKLSGILDSLQMRFDQAVAERWSFSDFLDRLLQDEVERRDTKQLSRRLVKSGLSPEKTLEVFDFSFNPRIHEPALREIALCGFMKPAENVFLVGPSGVGKSHLAQAIGHDAVRRGHEVLFRRTNALFQWIGAGRADGSRERRLRSVIATPLLILDDFGLQPMSDEAQSDLYEVEPRLRQVALGLLESLDELGGHGPPGSSCSQDRDRGSVISRR